MLRARRVLLRCHTSFMGYVTVGRGSRTRLEQAEQTEQAMDGF